MDIHRQAFQRHPVAMLWFDLKTGRILEANPAAERFYGRDLTSLQQLTVADISLLEVPAFNLLVEEIERGERNCLELRQLLPSDEIREVRMYVTPIPADGRQLVHGIIHDLTAQRAAEARSREQEERLQLIAENILGVVYQFEYVPSTGVYRVPYASPGINEVFCLTAEEVREDASPVFARFHPDDFEATLRSIEESGSTLTPWQREFRLYFPPEDGRPERTEWIEGQGKPQLTTEGTVLWHGFISLITNRKKLEEQLIRQAYHDTLTDLPNRALFHDRLGHAILRARRSELQIAVLYMDLDGFKDINDGWGHATGDQLLQVVATRITINLRAGDTVARLGGDELVVIAEGLENASQVEAIAAKLRSLFHIPITIGQQQFVVRTSIGISIYPGDGHTAELLLQHADAALYLAKQLGGDQYAYFCPELQHSATERATITAQLKQAIEAKQCSIALQPIIRLRDEAVVGMEALARWYHPEHGWISPARFIPVAESTGLIQPLGEWILRTACAHAASWSTDDTCKRIAVNVSIRQLQSPNFTQLVLSVLADTGLAPSSLEMEITESVFINEDQQIIRTLNALQVEGVTLAIADFGTGSSSLPYLKCLPVDRLKIDHCFIQNLPRDPHNQAIVRAFVALARELGLELTAEGVETREESEFLASIGCETVQGIYYGQPQQLMSATAAE